MAKLKIEYLPLSEFRLYKNNARTHSPEQVEQIVHSIQQFGFTNPVLIDQNNEVIAGHGRLQAAEILNLDSVPSVRITDLDERQVKALRIADNQLALNAGWDLDLLAAEIVELEGEEFNLDLLGFDDDFLAGLLPDDELPEEQEQPEPTVNDSDPNVSIVVGPYEISVQRSDWDRWETALRAKVGFDKVDIAGEIKKRLKM